MKGFRFELAHLVIIGTSLISAVISIRQNIGLRRINQILNPVSGFFAACLTGLILRECGVEPWLASGFAYIMGQAGNKVMDILLTALKMAERDPLKFAASVIALIWQWILPPITRSQDPK